MAVSLAPCPFTLNGQGTSETAYIVSQAPTDGKMLDGSVTDRSTLSKRMTEAAGVDVEVRHLVSTTTVVIDGLDATITVEEVQEAVRKDISEGIDGLKVSITQPIK
ncbi:unnamed protein product [Arctia plantaginis]|uniref:Uncharacterized protein n=1 Tax=Arctia plantaginis TaxID=874455 RepID=A0A8S1A9M7_ARCPL|nr:unnamed protein product [Arctia plantaginis]